MREPIYLRLLTENAHLDATLWDARIDLADDPTLNAEAFVAASFGWLLRDWEQVSAA
jgi:hypothetical protein